MRLDSATRRLLGLRNPWPVMVALHLDARTTKQHRDKMRMAAMRLSAAVKSAEAQYQKAYAATPNGREARKLAKRRYRARLAAKRAPQGRQGH